MKSELPREVAKALAETLKDVPWEVKPGSKHCKIVVDGHMVGIAPDAKGRDVGRHLKNLLAQCKRAAEVYRRKVLTPA